MKIRISHGLKMCRCASQKLNQCLDFKRNEEECCTWSVAFDSGLGLGMGYTNCQNDFRSPYMIYMVKDR
uniref:Uncharacterized protein n=1 Tax=Acanthochromis polyacanthus TaxID=80966 RepID=A0A3Q1FPP6_9TELE